MPNLALTSTHGKMCLSRLPILTPLSSSAVVVMNPVSAAVSGALAAPDTPSAPGIAHQASSMCSRQLAAHTSGVPYAPCCSRHTAAASRRSGCARTPGTPVSNEHISRVSGGQGIASAQRSMRRWPRYLRLERRHLRVVPGDLVE
eukprot:2750998-Rhodomonas_salina.1